MRRARQWRGKTAPRMVRPRHDRSSQAQDCPCWVRRRSTATRRQRRRRGGDCPGRELQVVGAQQGDGPLENGRLGHAPVLARPSDSPLAEGRPWPDPGETGAMTPLSPTLVPDSGSSDPASRASRTAHPDRSRGTPVLAGPRARRPPARTGLPRRRPSRPGGSPARRRPLAGPGYGPSPRTPPRGRADRRPRSTTSHSSYSKSRRTVAVRHLHRRPRQPVRPLDPPYVGHLHQALGALGHHSERHPQDVPVPVSRSPFECRCERLGGGASLLHPAGCEATASRHSTPGASARSSTVCSAVVTGSPFAHHRPARRAVGTGFPAAGSPTFPPERPR